MLCQIFRNLRDLKQQSDLIVTEKGFLSKLNISDSESLESFQPVCTMARCTFLKDWSWTSEHQGSESHGSQQFG